MDDCLTTIFRTFRKFFSVDAAHEDTLHAGLSPGGFRTLSRLDEVGAVVRLRPQLTNPADEDVDPTEGDPVPVLN